MRLFKDRLLLTLTMGLLPGFLISAISSSALAAQYKLYINKEQSASNVIVFEDSMSATVTHTSEGMELTLPGVEVALRCKSSGANTSTNSCVIAIEPGTNTSSSGGSTSGGSTSGGSTSGGSTSGGSTSGGDCVVTTWNNCGGGSTSGGSTSGGSTSGGSTSGGSTSGGSTSGGGSSSGSGTCTNSSSVECGSLNFGSGGTSATGATNRLNLFPGLAVALPFTTTAGTYYGKVGIVPTSDGFPTDGAEVRMYWSTEAGGTPLSNDCQANLGREGALYWDQANVLGFGCPIPNQSGKLFLNFKLCISDVGDGSCSGPNVRYGEQSATVYVSGSRN